MNAAVLSKQDIEAITEVVIETQADDAAPSAGKPAEGSGPRLKLPSAKAVFEGLWPPVVGVGTFLALWAVLAPMVETSLGALPGPGDVWTAFLGLMEENAAARAEAAVAEMGSDGRVVLVAEAVLAGDAEDATAELEARIARRLKQGPRP